MLVFQTLIVYISFFITFSYYLKRASTTNKILYITLASFVFALISGLRYGVGFDSYSYMNDYEYYARNGFFLSESEIGFEYLMRIVSFFELNYGVLFGITGFLQVFFILYSLKKDKYVYPFLAFTFVSSCIWLSYFNGIRQSIAFSLFSFSILHILNKNLVKFTITVFAATLFHKSAILLLLIYPLFINYKDWIKNVKIQMCLLFLSIIIMKINVIQNVISQFESIISYMGYGVYLEDRYINKIQNTEELNFGLGFIITFLTNLSLILFSTKAKQWIRSDFFTLCYTLSFIGIIINYSFFSSHLITRLNWYLYGFVYISGAFILYYLYHKKKTYFYILAVLFSLTFIATMYRMRDNTSLYIFNFQKEFFYIKEQFYREII